MSARASLLPLVAQTLLEAAAVAWAGWEIWSLRSGKTTAQPKAEAEPVSTEPPSKRKGS